MKSKKVLTVFLIAGLMACGHDSAELLELRGRDAKMKTLCAALPLRVVELLKRPDVEVVAAGSESAMWFGKLCPEFDNEAQMMDRARTVQEIRDALTSIGRR